MHKKNITILVADKSDAMLATIQRELRRFGYQKLISAKDGSDAWSLLNDYDVSLAIVDFALEKISGIDLAQQAKKSEELFAVRFLITAVASDMELLPLGVTQDIAEVLLKPFSSISLMERVELILKVNSEEKEVQELYDPAHNEDGKGAPTIKILNSVLFDTGRDKYEKMKVLVADDSSAMLSVVKGWLERLGFVSIYTAKNGEEAWNTFKKENDFDLIVSDWKMPKMSGVDLLDKVRAENQSTELPFILVTSEATVESILEAGRHKATGYITKPCNIEKFSAVLRKVTIHS